MSFRKIGSNLLTVALLAVGLGAWVVLPWYGVVALAAALGAWLFLSRQGKLALAAHNFQRAGLEPWIEQLAGEAGTLLPTLPAAAYQLIFLDSERRHYQAWWPEIQRLLSPRGLLVVDNAISHREEMNDWMAEVAQDPAFLTALVPVGKGEFLAVRR